MNGAVYFGRLEDSVRCQLSLAQCLMLSMTVCGTLAVPCLFRNSPVSVSRLDIAMLGLQTCATTCAFTCILEFWLQVSVLAWQALSHRAISPGPYCSIHDGSNCSAPALVPLPRTFRKPQVSLSQVSIYIILFPFKIGIHWIFKWYWLLFALWMRQ